MEQPYIDRMPCEFRTQLIKHFMDRNIVMRPRFQSERETDCSRWWRKVRCVSLPEHSSDC